MKFYIESYGCTMNQGEGDNITRALTSLGFEQTPEMGEAGLLILNSCVVIQPTEKKMVQRLLEFKKAGRKIMVTGCMADVGRDRILELSPSAHVIETGRATQLKEVVDTALSLRRKAGEAELTTETKKTEALDSPNFILPISEGCLGSCSYCITRFARGRLTSYPMEELATSFALAVERGAREIFLTSQDTGIYGQDRGRNLPLLLKRLLTTEGRYFLRIGMMNPDSLRTIFRPFFDLFKSPNIYKFLHVPVQSGSDSVLAAMRRNYRAEEYIQLIKDARKKTEFTLSTDIIVGFPGETGEDFGKSVSLVKELRPEVVNITRFSERPGTEATTLSGKVHGRISKERSRVLTELVELQRLEDNQRFLGQNSQVLITKKGHHGASLGRNELYKAVAIHQELEMGEFYQVKIKEAHVHYLVGELVDSL